MLRRAAGYPCCMRGRPPFRLAQFISRGEKEVPCGDRGIRRVQRGCAGSHVAVPSALRDRDVALAPESLRLASRT